MSLPACKTGFTITQPYMPVNVYERIMAQDQPDGQVSDAQKLRDENEEAASKPAMNAQKQGLAGRPTRWHRNCRWLAVEYCSVSEVKS